MKIQGNTVGTNLKPETAIGKIKNLTDEQATQFREKIGAVSKKQMEEAIAASGGGGGGGSSTGDTHSIKKLELICPENDLGPTSIDLTGVAMVSVENGETSAPALLLNSNNSDVVVIRGVHPGENDTDAVNKKQMDDAIATVKDEVVNAVLAALPNGDEVSY